jgi:hypothetical protein
MNILIDPSTFVPVRAAQWHMRTDFKIVTNGRYIDLLALVNNQWYYMTTLLKTATKII